MIRHRLHFAAILVAAVTASVALGGCATSSFRTEKNLPADAGQRRIVVLPPDVRLDVLHVGGVPEPNAEWTKEARHFIVQSLGERFHTIHATLINGAKITPDPTGDPREYQLLKLHRVVGNAILLHQYPGPLQLPTKANSFDWSLGPGTSYLRKKYGADYALFVYVRDSYSSDARKAVIFVGALLGVAIQGGLQVGFASLVDLRNGNVVWFNRLIRDTGDLRTAPAAEETVAQLLSNFPQ